ncbi:hypothetical protein K7432_015681 [Basidiobolus ranarum]|uniref:Uncharacterized protein n=1 Tax=Basidiobolus ranarum TaxID=34480 RepID=A0ABR2VMX4_9FUNG
MIGEGRKYWSCKSTLKPEESPDNCPTSFKSPQGEYDIYWNLVDTQGFESFLLEMLGVNLADLDRATASYPMSGGCYNPIPFASRSESNLTLANGVTSLSTSAPRIAKRSEDDPFKPDPSCIETDWHGVLKATDKIFVHPSQPIQEYVASAILQIKEMEFYAFSDDVPLEDVARMANVAISSVVSGNHTLEMANNYIYALAEALDKEAQEKAAREAMTSLLIDIGITLLSFAIGPILGGVARGITLAARGISGALKAARVARGGAYLAESSAFEKAFAKGIASIDDIKAIASGLKTLMPPWVRNGVTKAKNAVASKLDTTIMKCLASEAVEEGVSIGLDSWVIPKIVSTGLVTMALPGMLSNASNSPNPSSLGYTSVSLTARGLPYSQCPWTMGKADDMKGHNYEDHCKNSISKISFPPALIDGLQDTAASQLSFAEMTDFTNTDQRYKYFYGPQCDHAYEAQELLSTLRNILGTQLSKKELNKFCDAFWSKEWNDKITKTLNHGDNMFGSDASVNSFKGSLIKGDYKDSSPKVSANRLNPEVFSLTESYMDSISASRQKTASNIQKILNDIYSSTNFKKLESQYNLRQVNIIEEERKKFNSASSNLQRLRTATKVYTALGITTTGLINRPRVTYSLQNNPTGKPVYVRTNPNKRKRDSKYIDLPPKQLPDRKAKNC